MPARSAPEWNRHGDGGEPQAGDAQPPLLERAPAAALWDGYPNEIAVRFG